MKLKIKTYGLLLFTAFCFFTACDSDDDNSQPSIEVEGVLVKTMTYNIYSGQLRGIVAIADVINKVDPDIVGLQEVETKTNKIPEDVINSLLQKTEMKYYHFAKTHNTDGGEYGNLILSKYPLSDAKTYDLGVIITTGSFPRSLGVVKLEIDGKEFYFANTHLDHLSDITNKMHQIEKIKEYTKDLDKPIIIAGDFNAVEGSDPLNSLLEKFTLGCLNGNCGLTTGTPIPSKAIDFLMFAPADSVTPIAYDVFYDAFTESDHFPVVATFKVHK